jgi:prophage tail gpP-like protein
MDNVSLSIGGVEYSGWTSVLVRRSLDEFCSSFMLDLADTWHSSKNQIPFNAGDSCSIKVGKDLILTGYIDEISVTSDSEDHILSVLGRSKAGDLVDCSAIYKTGTFVNQTLVDIAKKICSPFGISAKTDVTGIGTIKKVSIQDGETCFDFLNRSAKMEGLLLTSTPSGDVLFTRAGRSKRSFTISSTTNAIKCEYTDNKKDVFSSYIFKGQTLTGEEYRGKNYKPKASASDALTKRYRPIIIQAESQAENARLSVRAKWERNVRRSQAKKIAYTIPGWRENGVLWDINSLVSVADPILGIEDTLLIASVELSLDESGTKTTLELVHPNAYSIFTLGAEKAKKKKSGSILGPL